MRSTWRTDKSQWGFPHWVYDTFNLYDRELDKAIPVFEKIDRVPIVSTWQSQRFVLIYALVPIAIHQAYVWFTGENFNVYVAFLYYNVALKVMGTNELHILRRLGHQVGFLDGDKHPRDEVSDHGVGKVLISLFGTADVRSLFSMIIAYKQSEAPATMNCVALPFEIALYSFTLDFYFYWYH